MAIGRGREDVGREERGRARVGGQAVKEGEEVEQGSEAGPFG